MASFATGDIRQMYVAYPLDFPKYGDAWKNVLHLTEIQK